MENSTINSNVSEGTPVVKLNLLIGFTGSVATIKDEMLIKSVLATGLFKVKAIYTKAATHFKSKG